MTTIKSILCPHDFSEASVAALRFARDLALDTHAVLHLVHAVSPGGYMQAASGKSHPGMFEDYERKANDDLHAVAKELGAGGVLPEARVVYGAAHKVILAEAERVHANLIVMAAHGHGITERFILGSVADRVLRTATLPVTIVRGP